MKGLAESSRNSTTKEPEVSRFTKYHDNVRTVQKPKLEYQELEMTMDAWMRRIPANKKGKAIDPKDPNPFGLKVTEKSSLSKRTEEIIDSLLMCSNTTELKKGHTPIKSANISEEDQPQMVVLKGLFANNVIDVPAFDVDLELCRVKRDI